MKKPKKKKPLTVVERETLRKSLIYFGLGLIADDILDWIDDRRATPHQENR